MLVPDPADQSASGPKICTPSCFNGKSFLFCQVYVCSSCQRFVRGRHLSAALGDSHLHLFLLPPHHVDFSSEVLFSASCFWSFHFYVDLPQMGSTTRILSKEYFVPKLTSPSSSKTIKTKESSQSNPSF